jgi:hypothetical protein
LEIAVELLSYYSTALIGFKWTIAVLERVEQCRFLGPGCRGAVHSRDHVSVHTRAGNGAGRDDACLSPESRHPCGDFGQAGGSHFQAHTFPNFGHLLTDVEAAFADQVGDLGEK